MPGSSSWMPYAPQGIRVKGYGDGVVFVGTVSISLSVTAIMALTLYGVKIIVRIKRFIKYQDIHHDVMYDVKVK